MESSKQFTRAVARALHSFLYNNAPKVGGQPRRPPRQKKIDAGQRLPIPPATTALSNPPPTPPSSLNLVPDCSGAAAAHASSLRRPEAGLKRRHRLRLHNTPHPPWRRAPAGRCPRLLPLGLRWAGTWSGGRREQKGKVKAGDHGSQVADAARARRGWRWRPSPAAATCSHVRPSTKAASRSWTGSRGAGPAARASWPAATGSSGQDARASGAVLLVADGRPPVGVDGPRMPPAGQRRGATDTGRRRGGERRRRAGRARLAGTAGSSSTGPAADGERRRRIPPGRPKRRAAAPGQRRMPPARLWATSSGLRATPASETAVGEEWRPYAPSGSLASSDCLLGEKQRRCLR